MSNLQPFHLAIRVSNLQECREFYANVIGCSEGRSSSKWVDFNFYGHQLVIHHHDSDSDGEKVYNPVDGEMVPVPHFGVVLQWDDWQELATRLREKQINFVIEPYIRFAGEVGEQATMFFLDPSGNALEFKSFKDISNLFAK